MNAAILFGGGFISDRRGVFKSFKRKDVRASQTAFDFCGTNLW
jgi:hypothetical protein